MSAEKVRRYDMQYRPDWAYNQASMMPSDQGRYIEYADVAGLVEALRTAEEWMQLASCTHLEFGLDDPPITTARNELARWQS